MTLDARDRARLDAIGVSRIARHGDACCGDARLLLLARLHCHPDLGSQMAAVPSLVRWGPTPWPHHWCELMRPSELVGDCGVHADLASTLLTRAGIAHERGRAAIAPSGPAVSHWSAAWGDARCSDRWISPVACHHEVIKVGSRWWDPTEARWFAGAGAHLESGRVIAVRTEGGQWSLSLG